MHKKFHLLALILLLPWENLFSQNLSCMLPILVSPRTDLSQIRLSPIGAFGRIRKARPGIPQHYHTGIDIKRPNSNYNHEPIFPLAAGRVISLLEDGPFAQIIIEHELEGIGRFWSVYEHVAGILIGLDEQVSPDKPLARFLNRQELERYGWQFDHFHLEILKVKPRSIKPTPELPFYHYQSYNLECYSWQELKHFYFDPIEFLTDHLNLDEKNDEVDKYIDRFSGTNDQ